jgi:predicted dienelactone hydrolase
VVTLKSARTLGPLVVALLCVPGMAAGKCPSSATTQAYAARGTFDVGVLTLRLVDASRATPPHAGQPGAPDRKLTVEVWYPATSGSSPPALARGGPFPLVVSSPGLLDNRLGETYYTEALASRGFVVASIDFPLTNTASLGAPGGPYLGDLHNQPGDVHFVIDELLRRSHTSGDPLAGAISRRRIGATGLSLGAVTTLLVTYHPTLRDRRIRAALPIAPGGACAVNEHFFARTRRPLLALVGEQDLILPPDANALPALDLVRSRSQLVTLVAGTHTAFSAFVTQPASTSYDTIGCMLLASIGQWGNPFDGLGGPAEGIDPGAFSCTRICQDPVPPNPPMQALRQHELTRAVEAAFFESALRGSHAARCFLRARLGAENADVRLEATPGRR